MRSPIPHAWDVPQVFRDRMGETPGRQRTMAAEGHLLIVLHELPDPKDPTARVPQLFWRNPEGRWRSTTGKGATATVIKDHQQHFTEVAEQMEERLEQATTSTDYFTVLQQVTPALRTVRNAHRTLQDARDAASKDRELISVRDAAQELERAFEILHGNAKDGLEFLAARNTEESARNSERMNRSSHQLNLIATVFLPITALGSLLGMNLRSGLEDWHAPYAFWAASALAFVFGYWIRARLPKPDR